MPIKRKSTKKKASSVDDATAEPDTMLSDGISGGMEGKKKKKKKKKISKADKLKVKLEKATDQLRNSGEPFQYLINSMDQWFITNSDRVIAFFKQFDEEGEGLLSYEEFKSGMFDLNAPVNTTELHLLCQLLDIDETEEIEYMSLSEGLSFVRERELDYEAEDIRPTLARTKRDFDHCKCCKMAVWDGENFKESCPRYIKINLKLATFENFKNHPGHLYNQVLPIHTTVSHLMDILRKETNLLTTRLAIFKDTSRDKPSMLPAEYSLEQCGFEGSTIDEPTKVELFYDYKIEFKECPILMCDHYFVKDK